MNQYHWIALCCIVVIIHVLIKEYVRDKLCDPDCWWNRPRCHMCKRKMVFMDYSHPSGCRVYSCQYKRCVMFGEDIWCH